MEAFRCAYYPNCYPAFDGNKNLYSLKTLPESSGEVSLNIDGLPDSKPVVFKISIKLARQFDLSILQNYASCRDLTQIQSVCQLLGVVLRARPYLELINVGRNFYSPPPEMTYLACGTELFRGFHQAMSLTSRGPMINIDVIHKAFVIGGPLLELIKTICWMKDTPRKLDEYNKKDVLEVILDKKVEYKVHSHTVCYSVNGFKGPAKLEIIPDTKMTVLQYFKKEKQYDIKYPDLPLLWVGSKQREHPILIPIELCSLKRGQSARRSTQENSEIIRAMITLTATPPDDRRKRIVEQLQNAGYRDNPYLKEFGISISEDFELVNARVLDPPRLTYQNSEVMPNRGAWDIRSKKFLKPKTLKKWVVLSLDADVFPQKIKDLETEIMNSGRNLGMDIQKPDTFKFLKDTRTMTRDVQNYLKEKKEQQYELIIVILNDRTNFYGMVKQEAELNVGCLTQCLLTKTIRRDPIPGSVVTNILLKVNAKLNGTNHKLSQRPSFLKLRSCYGISRSGFLPVQHSLSVASSCYGNDRGTRRHIEKAPCIFLPEEQQAIQTGSHHILQRWRF
ncbi:unnamed protein product [Acanthoscelides obtectus]|nr:unnamed protein product [Acanthoscelides obtectus]